MKNWIPIRHDYLIDNFDRLLNSLYEADFGNPDDGILSESIAALEDVSQELLAGYFSHKLGIPNEVDNIFSRNVRIVLAAIYSSQKVGRDVSVMLVDLLDSLVINNFYSDEGSMAKIKEITECLSKGNRIEAFPYNLKDLAPDRFDFPLFKQQLLGLKLGNDHTEAVGYESAGSCLFEGDKIKIYPVGFSHLSDSKFKPVLEASLDVLVMDETKKKVCDLDFKEQELFLNHFKQSFSEETPKPAKKLKAYSEGQEFFVKVVNIDPQRGYITCRTIDPDYEPLELFLDLLKFLNLNIEFSITGNDFRNAIQPGQVLKVQLTERDGRRYFNFNDIVREFFSNIDNFQYSYVAIFVTNYPGGTRWLTEFGHIVNIMNNDWDSDILEAACEDCDLAIEVSGLNANTDKKGNTVMNANRIGQLYEGEPHDSFKAEIPATFLLYIFDSWADECPVFKTPEKRIRTVPVAYPRIISHLLCRLSEDMSGSFYERFYNAFCAKMLTSISESRHDESYCDFIITYLKALWAFAQDPGHKWLSPVTVEPELEGLTTIGQLRDIVSILSEYKTGNHSCVPVFANETDPERIHGLVNASNSLSGNIALSEINRIKRTITQCLGIEDLYTEESSDKFWFGEESDMLEFKSSVVFPPSKTVERPASPDSQIWQIIKTVNGFLNSLHGGTLLIGVNDFGNASGLEDDIQWLYRNRKIVSPDIDKYLLFVKNRIDHAFEAYLRKDSDTDVTSTRVRYSTEQRDCNTIVRVEVMPYEFGCVKIKGKLTLPNKTEIKRPNYIKEAYIRVANATEELTPGKREKIAADKRTVIKDATQQKQILVQEAIDTSRCLRIKGYQSYRGKSDKIIQPVELLPLRGLIIGSQQGGKDLRVFKLNRCEAVELTDERFKPSKYSYTVDPFNMLTLGKEGIKMQIRLDRLGWLRIMEVYPYTINSLKEDNSDPEYPYLLDCRISDLKGIGSFCLSIPGHFKVINCNGLADYLKEQLKHFHFS